MTKAFAKCRAAEPVRREYLPGYHESRDGLKSLGQINITISILPEPKTVLVANPQTRTTANGKHIAMARLAICSLTSSQDRTAYRKNSCRLSLTALSVPERDDLAA